MSGRFREKEQRTVVLLAVIRAGSCVRGSHHGTQAMGLLAHITPNHPQDGNDNDYL